MKLYITNDKVPPLSGIVIKPEFMALKVTHLTIASQNWEQIYVSVSDLIPEGSLRFLPAKSDSIKVRFEEKPSIHTVHLCIELYPELDGALRKAYMKGEDMHGVLLEMWWDRDQD